MWPLPESTARNNLNEMKKKNKKIKIKIKKLKIPLVFQTCVRL